MKSFGIFLGLLAFVCAAPVEQYIETNPELTAGYFEGDIVLDNRERNGMVDTAYRWPNKVVLYKIAAGYFDTEHVDQISQAMRLIEAVSCIRFTQAAASATKYVSITGKTGGCFSSVGYRATVQTCNYEIAPLDTGCFKFGKLVHELLHTLGFYHMQSDWTRDNFVTIHTENIKSGAEGNFLKYSHAVVTDFGQSYDYESLLHYPAYAFSKNGEMTIVPKNYTGTIGNRDAMSAKDILKLNSMYNCPAVLASETV